MTPVHQLFKKFSLGQKRFFESRPLMNESLQSHTWFGGFALSLAQSVSASSQLSKLQMHKASLAALAPVAAQTLLSLTSSCETGQPLNATIGPLACTEAWDRLYTLLTHLTNGPAIK